MSLFVFVSKEWTYPKHVLLHVLSRLLYIKSPKSFPTLGNDSLFTTHRHEEAEGWSMNGGCLCVHPSLIPRKRGLLRIGLFLPSSSFSSCHRSYLFWESFMVWNKPTVVGWLRAVLHHLCPISAPVILAHGGAITKILVVLGTPAKRKMSCLVNTTWCSVKILKTII